MYFAIVNEDACYASINVKPKGEGPRAYDLY